LKSLAEESSVNVKVLLGGRMVVNGVRFRVTHQMPQVRYVCINVYANTSPLVPADQVWKKRVHCEDFVEENPLSVIDARSPTS
jgi:hypothetical protein